MVWSLSRVVRRAVPSLVCMLLAVTFAGMSPASAAGSGGGIVDGDVNTTVDPGHSAVRHYPALYFYGTLTASGTTYNGGFYITGMSDIEVSGPLPCTSICVPLNQTNWVGRDAGVVLGSDAGGGAVVGQCSIVAEADHLTGPLDLVEYERTIALSCSLSVLGGPVDSVALNVTAVPDAIGNIVGVYQVS